MGKISENKEIQGKEYTIGGIKLMVYPLNIDLLEYMMNMVEGEKVMCPHCRKEIEMLKRNFTEEERENAIKKNSIAMREVVYATMRESDPESSEVEIKKFCFKYVKEIMNAITEVNELKDGNATK